MSDKTISDFGISIPELQAAQQRASNVGISAADPSQAGHGIVDDPQAVHAAAAYDMAAKAVGQVADGVHGFNLAVARCIADDPSKFYMLCRTGGGLTLNGMGCTREEVLIGLLNICFTEIDRLNAAK